MSTAWHCLVRQEENNHFKLRLPHLLRFPGRGWEVGLNRISLPDARANVHAIVSESAYLVSAKWAAQQGRLLVPDDIDDLYSVVDGKSFMHACIDTLEAKEWVLSKRMTNGRLPRVNICTWNSNGFRKIKTKEMLIRNDHIYYQGFDTKARFYINRELALNMGWLTETNALGPNLRQEFIGGDVRDFKGQSNLKDLFIFKTNTLVRNGRSKTNLCIGKQPSSFCIGMWPGSFCNWAWHVTGVSCTWTTPLPRWWKSQLNIARVLGRGRTCYRGQSSDGSVA